MNSKLLVISSTRGGLLTSDAAWSAIGSEGTGVGKVDVLFRGGAYKIRWDIYHLFTYTNVPLLDEHTGMVDRLGKGKLEHLSLKAALQEFLCSELQNKVELLLLVAQETVSLKLAHNGGALKKPLWVFLWKGEKVTSGLADLSKGKLDTPDFTLAAKAVLTA